MYHLAVEFSELLCLLHLYRCVYQWQMTSGDLKVNDIFSKKNPYLGNAAHCFPSK